MAKHHALLADEGVTVSAIFSYQDDGQHALKCNRYPAAATIKPSTLEQRARGAADVWLKIDKMTWMGLTDAQREALIDHELSHIERGDKEDSLGRPKLTTRIHDYRLEGFTDVVHRHGENAIESVQARGFAQSYQQMAFAWFAPKEAKAVKQISDKIVK
jgi:hypothetical protein